MNINQLVVALHEAGRECEQAEEALAKAKSDVARLSSRVMVLENRVTELHNELSGAIFTDAAQVAEISAQLKDA